MHPSLLPRGNGDGTFQTVANFRVGNLPDLPNSAAVAVLRGGGDLASLKEVLGHATLSITAGYLEATSESKRRAVGGLKFGGS